MSNNANIYWTDARVPSENVPHAHSYAELCNLGIASYIHKIPLT